jgi:hypothetical protein
MKLATAVALTAASTYAALPKLKMPEMPEMPDMPEMPSWDSITIPTMTPI